MIDRKAIQLDEGNLLLMTVNWLANSENDVASSIQWPWPVIEEIVTI